MDLEAAVRRYFKKKGLPWRPALTFNDVSIITKFSDVSSRSALKDFRTPIGNNFYLNIPIVSANMDTVTESELAIALARLGGLGFIHQFLPIEKRVREVARVKRADNALIENPVTISDKATLGEAKAKMKEHDISSILVIDEYGRLWGIITSRDYRFKTNDQLLVTEVMKWIPLVSAKPGISFAKAQEIFEKHRIEKLPLMDGRGRLCGLMSAKDILKIKHYPAALRDKKGRLAVGATVGVSGNYLLEAEQLLVSGVDAILLDAARGGATMLVDSIRAVRNLKKKFPNMVIVAGNIDNAEHVGILAKAGADCIKVGIGPGARCKTRMVAGVGAPQVYAVASCAAVAQKIGIPVIADGGIRGSNDLAKALVAGADAVMIGSLFAGTDESPGLRVRKGNQFFKEYRGSASLEHQLDRIKTDILDEVREPEGESAPVPYAGSVAYVVKGLMGGLRSAMSYIGAWTIKEVHSRGEFLWVTNEGYEEGKPQS